MASETDVFCKVGEPGTATTMTAPGHTTGGTSISVVSTANYPTDTGVIFAIDTVSIVDGKEVRDVGSYTEWEGTVGGATTLENMVLRYGDDQNYPAGATTRVYIPVSSSRDNRLVDGLLVAHDQNGKLLGTADSFVGTAGDIGGAWKEWTPTITGFNKATPTNTSKYTQIGKTIIGSCYIVSSTANGLVNGIVKITLPVTPVSGVNALPIGVAYLQDTGSSSYAGIFSVDYNDGGKGIVQASKSDGTYTGYTSLSSTSPFTWADGDQIRISFTYQAA